MAAYNSGNDLRCHANKYLLTDLLKDEFGLQGFVVPRLGCIENIPGDYKLTLLLQLMQNNMVMVPGAVRTVKNHLKFF
ncbi:hypothetical protein CM15mP37_12700 [bacterium]|nr:MAG: hypothetical protein CM15mP37_12700 [bacterium]